MARLKRFGVGVAAGVAGVAYARAILRRNAALARPRVRGPDGEALPERRFSYSDGEEVSVVDAGEGTTILWVPGADGPKETFRFQLPEFAERYRVVAADLRTHITSEHDFSRFADDLNELIEGLDAGPVMLVGQSLGSAIAIRFASRYPERLLGLVLANPLARVSYEHLGFNRVALIPFARLSTRYLPTAASRLLARLWSHLGVWIFDNSPGSEKLIDYALYTGPRTTPASVSDRRVDLLKGLDLHPELGSIAVPVLVVKGPEDVYVPVEWALAIAEAIPDALYVTIPGTGHMPHISMPGAFNQVVDRWLLDVIGPARETASDESKAAEGGSE